MQRALAFDRSPALGVPLRFFLNVPLFLLLAALVLGMLAVSEGPYSRWNPWVLAVTHLFTLGVMASAMLGAIMQILPVATHIHVLQPRVTSRVVHLCLTSGTLLLAAAFVNGKPALYTGAVYLLVAAFLVFIAAVTAGLLRHGRQRSAGSGEILVAVRLALVALAITVGLGAFMAGLRGSLWPNFLLSPGTWVQGMSNIHVVWGLAGWLGLLVIGISYQVIPIFQATEIYPRRMTETWAPLIFLLLVVFTVVGIWASSASGGSASLRVASVTLLAACYFFYGAVTFRLLWTRKRPAPEPTTWFWHGAMGALMVAAIVAAAHPWLSTPDARSKADMVLGTLIIPGFAVSAINGMLYKIIPFLFWHNAQRQAPVALPFMPKVRQFIDEAAALRQCVAHACAVVLLTAACLAPVLLLPAALALAVSACLLGANMLKAARLYTVTCRRIREAGAAHAA